MKTTAFKGCGPDQEADLRSLYPKVEEERRMRRLFEELKIRQTQMQPPRRDEEEARLRTLHPKR